jgi:hypothetical protein
LTTDRRYAKMDTSRQLVTGYRVAARLTISYTHLVERSPRHPCNCLDNSSQERWAFGV